MNKKIRVIFLIAICWALTSCLLSVPVYSGDTRTASFKPLYIQECHELETKRVITLENPIPCERLSKVKFSFLSDNGIIRDDGELIVLDVIAPNVASLMEELLVRKFYFAKVRPIEMYDGNDQASMADNNTSAFNGRSITGGSSWSLHAYGVAIDVNPLQNPFVDISEDGKVQILPINSARYSLNRSEHRPNKAKRPGMSESVVAVFAKYGFFVWGGDWNYPIDYQHFQIGPRSFVEALVKRDFEGGSELFAEFISMYKNCYSKDVDENNSDGLRVRCVEKVIMAMKTIK